MEKDWIKVYRTSQLYEARVIEALLKEHDIHAFVMNKQDSAYMVLLPGDIEIYTHAEQAEVAKQLINSNKEKYLA